MILLIAHETLGSGFAESAPLSAAHSAIGMAEMLAHEIKNPPGWHHGRGAVFIAVPCLLKILK